MKITPTIFFFILIVTHLFAKEIDLDELGWPRDLKFGKGVITIYQPQIESFNKNKTEARAAIAVKIDDNAPVFGAMWFTSRTMTDLDEHLVT